MLGRKRVQCRENYSVLQQLLILRTQADSCIQYFFGWCSSSIIYSSISPPNILPLPSSHQAVLNDSFRRSLKGMTCSSSAGMTNGSLSVCSPDSFLQPSLASFQTKFFLSPLELQDRQTTGKWEDANCKLAVLQVFFTSLLSHQYLLAPCFSGCTRLYLDWIHKTAWNHYWCDRQIATMFLAWKSDFNLCVLGVSQLKEHNMDLNTPFTVPDFNPIRLQEICLLKTKQLVANMGIKGKKGQ